MAKKYTGIYAKTLTTSDFDTTAYDGIGLLLPVFQSLFPIVFSPGNEMAFGSGSNSLGGVRLQRCFSLLRKMLKSARARLHAVSDSFIRMQTKVRATVIREDLTANVLGCGYLCKPV